MLGVAVEEEEWATVEVLVTALVVSGSSKKETVQRHYRCKKADKPVVATAVTSVREERPCGRRRRKVQSRITAMDRNIVDKDKDEEDVEAAVADRDEWRISY